jgi:nitrous oxidase accessory protein NosD
VKVLTLGLIAGLFSTGLVAFPTAFQSQPPHVFHPNDNIAAVVSRASPGTRFIFTAGVYRRQTITPKDGMSFVGEEGAILDGEGATAHAFETLRTHPRGVTIEGLTIQHYAPPFQNGAIQGDNGQGWVVSTNTIRDNHQVGIRLGPGFRVHGNQIYRNGTVGIGGYQADEVLIESNEIYENGGEAGEEDPATAEASGIKVLRSRDLAVRGNKVFRNAGKGIWSDTNYPTVVIERNEVSDNSSSGIWHEAGYAAVIRLNVVQRNGGPVEGSWLNEAGIQITNASNVQIERNTVTNNANGIGVMHTSGYPDGPYGPLRVENVSVVDNVVTMMFGRTGLSQNIGDRRVFTDWHNRFENTTYHLGPNRTYFLWDDRALDEHGWRATGNDRRSRFIRLREPGTPVPQ